VTFGGRAGSGSKEMSNRRALESDGKWSMGSTMNRSREEVSRGGEGRCEDGREAVSDGVVNTYFTYAFALEDVIPTVAKAATAWAVGFGDGVVNWKV
jgi:hypothetical protein